LATVDNRGDVRTPKWSPSITLVVSAQARTALLHDPPQVRWLYLCSGMSGDYEDGSHISLSSQRPLCVKGSKLNDCTTLE